MALRASARRLQAQHGHGGASRAPRPDLRALKAQHIEAARERIFGPQGSMPGDRQFRKPLEGRKLMRWYFPSKFNLQDFRIDEYYEMQAERFAPREDHRFVASLQQTLEAVIAHRDRLHGFFKAVTEETFLANPTLQDLYGLFRLCDPRQPLGFQPPEQVFKEHAPLFSRSPPFRSSSASGSEAWLLEARQLVMDKLSLQGAVKFDRQLQGAGSKDEVEAMLSKELKKKKIAPPVPTGQTTIRYWEQKEGAMQALEAHPGERDLSQRLQSYAVEDLAALCKSLRTRSAKKLEEFIDRQVNAWEERRPDLYGPEDFPEAFRARLLRREGIVAVEEFLAQQAAMWGSRWEAQLGAAVRTPAEVRGFLDGLYKIWHGLPETPREMGFEMEFKFDRGVFNQALSPESLRAALQWLQATPREMRGEEHGELLPNESVLSRQAHFWLERGIQPHTAEEVREAQRVRKVLLQWAEEYDVEPYFALALDTDDVCWARNLQPEPPEQDDALRRLRRKVADIESRGSAAQTPQEVKEVLRHRVLLVQEVKEVQGSLAAALERNRGQQAEEAAELKRKLAEELERKLAERTKQEEKANPEPDEQTKEAAESTRKLAEETERKLAEGMKQEAKASPERDDQTKAEEAAELTRKPAEEPERKLAEGMKQEEKANPERDEQTKETERKFAEGMTQEEKASPERDKQTKAAEAAESTRKPAEEPERKLAEGMKQEAKVTPEPDEQTKEAKAGAAASASSSSSPEEELRRSLDEEEAKAKAASSSSSQEEEERVRRGLEEELRARLYAETQLDALAREAADLERQLAGARAVALDPGVFRRALGPSGLRALRNVVGKQTPDAVEDAPAPYGVAEVWVRQLVLWCRRGMEPHTAEDIAEALEAWGILREVMKQRGFADEEDTERWDEAVHEAEEARQGALHLPLPGAPMVQRHVESIDLQKERRNAERDFKKIQTKGPKHLQTYVARRHRFVDPMFRRRRLKWLEREAAGQNKKRETEYNMYYAKHPDDHTEWPTNKASVTVVWPSPYH